GRGFRHGTGSDGGLRRARDAGVAGQWEVLFQPGYVAVDFVETALQLAVQRFKSALKTVVDRVEPGNDPLLERPQFLETSLHGAQVVDAPVEVDGGRGIQHGKQCQSDADHDGQPGSASGAVEQLRFKLLGGDGRYVRI